MKSENYWRLVAGLGGASVAILVSYAFSEYRASVVAAQTASYRRECTEVVDDFVALTARLEERLRTIPECDCPGPEECDMEATCNRDAMRCCLTLARQQVGP